MRMSDERVISGTKDKRMEVSGVLWYSLVAVEGSCTNGQIPTCLLSQSPGAFISQCHWFRKVKAHLSSNTFTFSLSKCQSLGWPRPALGFSKRALKPRRDITLFTKDRSSFLIFFLFRQRSRSSSYCSVGRAQPLRSQGLPLKKLTTLDLRRKCISTICSSHHSLRVGSFQPSLELKF